MNKIIAGILGTLLTIGVAGGAVYAVYTSQATAAAVVFETGNANLQLWNGSGWVTTWSPSNFIFSGMYPGYGGSGVDETNSTQYQQFFLKNLSTSDISLDVTAKLRDGVTESPPGAWDVLKDKVYVAVLLPDWSGGTGWHTLNEWNTTGYSLPGGSIAQNVQREYRFYVRVDGSVGNEISGQSLSAIQFDFNGTQSP